MWEAVDAVGLREAVEDLARGLDTLPSREVFGGSELLILDEPTFQMNPRGKHQIFEQIRSIAADRITLVIIHRLENARVADHVVVMEHGRITEQGRCDDLSTLAARSPNSSHSPKTADPAGATPRPAGRRGDGEAATGRWPPAGSQ